MKVIKCRSCGIKNRVEPLKLAERQAKCGKCGTPLDPSEDLDEVGAGKPLIVTDANFQETLNRAGDLPLLLDCWAEWCGPCRMIAPVLDQLAAESGGRYLIGKLNVDENVITAARFNIRSIPSLLIFKKGQLVDRLVGAQPKQAIAEHLLRAA
ncbi:MAG TPA: thioredoxin [Pyrinomonadaceae bacterium]|nr:thioredoxin [Pyrinomonadaceae bacterium]